MPQPIQTERRAEVALDQAGRQQGFPGIAQGEGDRAHDVSIAKEIGHDGRDDGPNDDRPSRTRTERDQSACCDASRRPKYSHAIGSQEGEA